jgi:GntR family transcriptional regulator
MPRHPHYDPHVPIYFQIENLLRKRIQVEGTPGMALPSELELAREFRVTRSTIRRALANLEEQKVIVRRKGSGTFVSDDPLEIHVKKLTGFIDDLMSHGLKTHAKVIERRATLATPAVAERLELKVGDPVLYVSRVRYVNDVPLVLTRGHLTWDVGARVLTENLEAIPIVHLLTKKYRISIPEAEQTVEAGLADPEVANLLEVPVASPILEVERVYYARRRRPKYYVQSFYRADRYKLTVTLRRRTM